MRDRLDHLRDFTSSSPTTDTTNTVPSSGQRNSANLLYLVPTADMFWVRNQFIFVLKCSTVV